MYYAQIDDTSVVVAITETKKEIKADNMILVQCYDVDLLGRKYKNGEFEDKLEEQEKLKINYTHKQWIERLGPDFVTLQQLRDNNDLLPPSEKNYELVRAFTLFDVSDFISLEDENLSSAFEAFVQLGLMTEERAQEILTPNDPAGPDDPE